MFPRYDDVKIIIYKDDIGTHAYSTRRKKTIMSAIDDWIVMQFALKL